MTPLAMEMTRHLIETGKQPKFKEMLTLCACYEVSSVFEIIAQTMNTLKARQVDVAEGIDHGGLLFCPAEYVWIELKRSLIDEKERGRVGFLLRKRNEFEIQLISPNGDMGDFLNASIVFNGDCFKIFPDKGTSKEDETLAGIIVSFAVSALILLNAPYGIDKAEHAPHKGFARNLRKQGLPAPKPYTIISLSKSAPAHLTGAGTGHHKAFHFVRSHLRRYENGLTSKVKAHWRGDPALGILKTDYKVVA